MIEYFNKLTRNEKYKLLAAISALALIFLPELTWASTITTQTDAKSFEGLYLFIKEAATGYLGRSIAIIGGIIGMGYAAASGKVLPAIVGVMLAIFGSIGPKIIDSLMGGALI